MTEKHPINPPPELVQKWVSMLEYCEDIDVFSDIAQWGADKELEACCEWMFANARFLNANWIEKLRAARRRKPVSKKQRALKALEQIGNHLPVDLVEEIRIAVESLPDE